VSVAANKKSPAIEAENAALWQVVPSAKVTEKPKQPELLLVKGKQTY